MTHAPTPVTPPVTQPPKPENPEPLLQPDDPEKRSTPHPKPIPEHEHPQELTTSPGPRR